MTARRLLPVAVLCAAWPVAASAQTCPCPPAPVPGWHGSAGLGLSLTAGNTDTRSFNARLQATYDGRPPNVVRIDGLYIHASTDDEDSAHNSALGLRDEYSFGRSFLFGEVRYQSDRFKELAYLITPAVGAGYQIVKRETVEWSWDAGVGGAFEKLEDRDSTADVAVQAGESLGWAISPNARLTHAARAVWKVNDFADAYYHVESGLTASVVRRLEMKLGLIVDVKNKPALPTLKKHDEAVLASLLFKF